MRKREYYWSLYHQTERNQLDALTTDQVEAVYSAIPKAQRNEWLIWRDGFSAWKSFEDFPDLIGSLRRTDDHAFKTPPPASTALTASAPANSDTAADNTGEIALSLVDKTQAEDRGNYRFDRKLDVRVIIGDQAFPNVTENISMKGMQLKTALPNKLPRYFNIEVRAGESLIPVVCSEVKSSDGTPSTRVKIEVNDYASALLTFLLAG